HLDRVPGTNRELVGIGLFLRNVDTDFAADAALDIDLAPGLIAFHSVLHRDHRNAIDRTDFEARFAARAVVGVDDRHLFGQLFSGSGFGHINIVVWRRSLTIVIFFTSTELYAADGGTPI